MPRRRVASKRKILPDPVYGSTTIAKFINRVMTDGKKSVAERIVYGALQKLFGEKKKKSDKHDAADAADKTKKTENASGPDVVTEFTKALENIRPAVEVKSRRVGGSTYQVPVEVRQERGVTLAMRWLIEAAKKRSEKTMSARLAAELGEAIENRGSAVKKRTDMHQMAKANQAFAHYRW